MKISTDIDVNKDYWFTIEPYVYITIKSSMLLYNTLDANSIETQNPQIINLVREILNKNNCGVISLKKEQLRNDEIVNFIEELRNKFMGDIIPILSLADKPIQLIPILNFQQDIVRLERQPNMSIGSDILNNLYEVKIHFDSSFKINIGILIGFLYQIESIALLHLSGNLLESPCFSGLLEFLNNYDNNKIIDISCEAINNQNLLSVLSIKKANLILLLKKHLIFRNGSQFYKL